MKIGLFGGSFDPIHNGHLMLAENARVNLGLDLIIFIPCWKSPYQHKTESVGFISRYQMIDKALKHNYYMRVSNYEYKKDPSYTIDTLKRFKKHYPKDQLYLIVGPDGVKTFDTWKDNKEYDRYAIVVFAGKNFFCPKVYIRSTLIRKMLKNGNPIRYLVPDTVNKYIKEKGLYK
jgi:nicotinate-nucleotide adenylyltransferase